MNCIIASLSRLTVRGKPKLLQCNPKRTIFMRALSQSVVTANTEMKTCKSKNDFPHKMKMRGWHIHSYGDLDELTYSDNIRIPQIKHATEVLIRIKAVSVNPIDVAIIGGYGATLLNVMRMTDIEFPLIVGRDFVGEIIYRGIGVPKNLKLGDTVWGVIAPHSSGCHCEYVVQDSSLITNKPHSLSNIEASGILYCGLTAWSGLFLSGDLGNMCRTLRQQQYPNEKRVLILGASGGVGTMAVQIAKNEKATVFATAASDATEMLSHLGADCVIDYKNENFLKEIHSNGPYDIILDCAGYGPKFVSKIECDFGSYVTFSSPLLRNIDTYGFVSGNIQNAMSLIEDNSLTISKRGRGFVKWGYFVAMQRGIEYLKKMADQGKLKCVIDSVYGFDNAMEAYQKVKDGHLRGKIIMDLS
uniref:Enoyl reductase (ER) domain-containing protein n=1 Tax=Lutzomyia longipalpis TaxID=7200 RepID=A0A1B0GKC9_LUTLO